MKVKKVIKALQLVSEYCNTTSCTTCIFNISDNYEVINCLFCRYSSDLKPFKWKVQKVKEQTDYFKLEPFTIIGGELCNQK